ncbi:MAG: hypothetical protein E5X58_13970 [Mesorhizobium sp.]|nr:MAG: hypothetical protein E5X58_13970 [Mesorhizobium sp.]
MSAPTKAAWQSRSRIGSGTSSVTKLSAGLPAKPRLSGSIWISRSPPRLAPLQSNWRFKAVTNENENAAQARISFGRDINTLDPQTRLEWHYAADIEDEKAAPVAEESHNPVQAEFLQNLGKNSVADLAADELEMYEFMNRFDKKPDEDSGGSTPPPTSLPSASPPARQIGPDSALDPTKVAGLRPELRLELENRLQRVKHKLSGYSTLADRQEVADGELYLRPYLR